MDDFHPFDQDNLIQAAGQRAGADRSEFGLDDAPYRNLSASCVRSLAAPVEA